MKITIIQGAFFPVPPMRGGAVEKLWHRLGQEFALQGHDIVHVSRRYPGLPEENREAGVHYIRVRGYDQPAGGLWLKFRDLQYTRRAIRCVPKSDIIVTNTFWAPVLLNNRGNIYVSVERMPKGQMRFYRSAARLCACSEAVREAILREDSAAASRVCVIPNPLPEVPVETVLWAEKENRILYVGRIHPEKGIDLLLSAFVRAKARGALSGWTLELVGPSETRDGGGGREWAQGLRERYRSADIEWTGPLFDSTELAGRYKRARIFAYPSLAERGETFGVAPLEAMAWGAVPIVSDLDCFKDFIIAGGNGLVFDHRGETGEENLVIALSNIDRRPLENLSREALRVRTTHAPGRIAEIFLADFAKIVGPQSAILMAR